MRTRRSIPTLVIAGVLLFTAGCGGSDTDDAAAPAADEASAATSDGGLTVVATEFAFEPGDISLAADEDVELTLENAGVVEHDITVDELDLEIYADATETVTETVNVPAGTYEYYCSIPGHRSSGMEGTLTAS